MTTHEFVSDLPEQLYLAEQVRELDRIAIQEYGIPGFELMQKAARFAFHQLMKEWPETNTLTIFCGAGNNAGDGYLVASIAAKQGITTNIFAVTDPLKLSGDALKAYQTCVNSNLPVQAYCEGLFDNMAVDQAHHVIVDALLGTGLSRKVDGQFLSAINTINKASLPTLAIDIPSGLCSDTGHPKPEAVIANITTSFIGNKPGLMTGKGRDFSGRIYFSDLGIPATTYTHFAAEIISPMVDKLISNLPDSRASSHKGTHGRALLIGGNSGFGGALLLASKACARMGAGLTSCFTRDEHRPALLQCQPEVMAHSANHALQGLIDAANVIAIGPGLGIDEWAKSLLEKALQSDAFFILDADALNLLAQDSSLKQQLQQKHVMTPHPGEAARLLKCSVADIENDRLASVRELSAQYGGTALLKGSGSLICNQEWHAVSLCRYGNPGMATGGMGDVLTGMLTGLLSRYGNRASTEQLIQTATCLHAYAADHEASAKGEAGLLAGDIIDTARLLLNQKKALQA